MPDLDLLLPGYRVFHALESVVVLLPLALVFIILFDRLFTPCIARVAENRPRNRITQFLQYFGIDSFTILQSKRFTFLWLIRFTYSATVGILSHFLLDLPTHDWISYFRPFFDGPMPSWFTQSIGLVQIPFYGMVMITRARVLWWIFTVGLGIVALYYLRYMKKHQLINKWYQQY